LNPAHFDYNFAISLLGTSTTQGETTAVPNASEYQLTTRIKVFVEAVDGQVSLLH
jgi:hypothetical protein